MDMKILYITERGVFRLRDTDIFLEEVAPGVDIDKDIISKMCFIPKVKTIKKMGRKNILQNENGNSRRPYAYLTCQLIL